MISEITLKMRLSKSPESQLLDHQRTEDEISRAAFDLLLKEPFYAHVLASMPRDLTERIPTVGLFWNGQQMVLRINPEWFCKGLTGPERKVVLKHEVLHLVFRHVFQPEDRDARLYSIAADLVVNQLIAPFKPLPDWPTLSMFPELGLKPDQTVDVYYAALAALLRTMRQVGFCTDKAKDRGRTEGKGNGRAKIADCADATGKPMSAQALAGLMDDRGTRADDSGWHDGRDTLGAVAGGYALGSLLIRARERMPRHMWLSLPAALLSELQLILSERQPKLDWKRMVRIFCAASGRTRIQHTLKRVSKRYGTRPGIKVKRLKRLLVAVDTSGSIDQKMIEAFFIEIHAAWRAGAMVHVVECDAKVQRDYAYSGKTPAMIAGGGGTDFEPVFRWMQDRSRFDGLLYLTDGCGTAPITRPGCRLLWVVVRSEQNAVDPDLPFGPTIHLEVH